MSSTNSNQDSERRRDSSIDRKDKKVHFSLIKGNSFEDLRNVRMDKEKQFQEYLNFKEISNSSIKESINKINNMSSRLESKLSNFVFSNQPNQINKEDDHIKNAFSLNSQFKPSKELELALESEENQDSNKKLGPFVNSQITHTNNHQGKDATRIEATRNKYNHIHERKNSISSNSAISEVSHSSKSQKFEKNMEKIKHISNNLEENTFLKNLMNKIDENLNSDGKFVETSGNNNVNTSQKTSNFEMLDRPVKYNNPYKPEEIIKIQNEIKLTEQTEELVKSESSMHSRKKENKGKDNVSNLIYNLTNNNNSIYHSFGESNQFPQGLKFDKSKVPVEAQNDLVENNSIEIIDTLNNSKKVNKEEETTTTNFIKLMDKLKIIYDKLMILQKKFFMKQIKHKSEDVLLQRTTVLFHRKMFFVRMESLRNAKRRKERLSRLGEEVGRMGERRSKMLKRKIFSLIKTYTSKQKEWISKMKYEFSKNHLWYDIHHLRQLLENWKLYVNYKKIKRYFTQKIKFKALNALNNNVKDSHNLEEKSIKLYYIMNMKYCLYNLRLNSKISRKHKTNNMLSKEFKQDRMKRKIFSLFKQYESQNKLSKRRQLDKLANKNKNSEYINLKIVHNTQIRNKKTETGETVTRITKNNIKIV